ncbi:MAG TPA: radical SAM protein [Blastocatellia bacterium]|nr:radical SAM protein [Blastocatellia bacterium]
MEKLDRSVVFIKKAANLFSKYVTGYMQPGRYKVPKVPAISVETTNICNAKCVFCANPVMLRRKEPLEMTVFKKTVDEFAAMGGKEIDFNVTIGDPLLDPYLLERARYVKRYPQFESLGFVTTLQWLHRFDLNEFFDCGFTWIAVSITLSGREKYLEFFGVDKYDAALENLITLITENKNRNNKFWIHVGLKPTDEPKAAILGHPDFQHINSLVEQDLISDINNMSFYCDDWIGAVKLPSYLKKRPLYPRAFRPCLLLYKGLMVYSNGNVGACSCRDFEADSDLILGNVKEQSLDEIWNGQKVAQIRSDWLRKSKVPEICKSCRHYLY